MTFVKTNIVGYGNKASDEILSIHCVEEMKATLDVACERYKELCEAQSN